MSLVLISLVFLNPFFPVGPLSSLKHGKRADFSDSLHLLFPVLQVLFQLVSTHLSLPRGSGLSLNVNLLECPSLTNSHEAAPLPHTFHYPVSLFNVFCSMSLCDIICFCVYSFHN